MRRRYSQLMGVCAGVCSALVFSGPASAADVDVAVAGIKSTEGRIMCRIFSDGTGFPIRGALATVHGSIVDGTSRCQFTGLREGRYAVAVLHDANDNGRLDKSMLGLPTEGLAFSQTVKPWFGVPSFSSAAFRLEAEGIRLMLRIDYP